jgi:hypothetical protein
MASTSSPTTDAFRRGQPWSQSNSPSPQAIGPSPCSLSIGYACATRHARRALELERLRESLPGVEIVGDGQALVFLSEDPDLGGKVRSAVNRVWGEAGWSDHFHSLDNGPEAAQPFPAIEESTPLPAPVAAKAATAFVAEPPRAREDRYR